MTIRRAEPSDAEAFAKIFSGPKVIWGSLQVPFPSVETWRKRLAEPPEGLYNLVACADDEVVGQLVLNTFPNRPRRRHAGGIGMAVRDDWQGKGVIHTAYLERLNATFRARLAGLVRRGRGLLHPTPTLPAGVYWVGTVYHFCTNHDSLRVPLYLGPAGRRHGVLRTPARAAGLTNHCWTVDELLAYQVPPARGTPPKRRGRPSKSTQELLKQWRP